MEQEYNYMVCTCCFTFNHALYIVDAMNGFTMQETTFPVITLIIDDGSTDDEQNVIRHYLAEHFQEPYRTEETDDFQLICANHNTNPNCTFIVYLLKYNHYSIKKSKLPYQTYWIDKAKYQALCEGDDYWISPHKLQRQIEYLETHPSHSLCFHAHYSVGSDEKKSECHRYEDNNDNCPMKDIILGGGGFMATASMVYVRSLYSNRPDWVNNCPIGDAPLMLVLAERGMVGYINELMSCYRVDVPGSWSLRISKNKRERKNLHNKMIQYKKDFDEWTGFKYHNYVRIALFYSNIAYYAKMLPIITKLIGLVKRFKCC